MPGESHEQGGLAGCSPELDTTKATQHAHVCAHTRARTHTHACAPSEVGVGRPKLETRKAQLGRLNNKGKHKVTVGNHPHTNIISKSATTRRVQIQEIRITLEIKRPAT